MSSPEAAAPAAESLAPETPGGQPDVLDSARSSHHAFEYDDLLNMEDDVQPPAAAPSATPVHRPPDLNRKLQKLGPRKSHQLARTEASAEYSGLRTKVSDEQVGWDVPYSEYAPKVPPSTRAGVRNCCACRSAQSRRFQAEEAMSHPRCTRAPRLLRACAAPCAAPALRPRCPTDAPQPAAIAWIPPVVAGVHAPASPAELEAGGGRVGGPGLARRGARRARGPRHAPV